MPTTKSISMLYWFLLFSSSFQKRYIETCSHISTALSKLSALHRGNSTRPTERLTLKLVKNTGRNSIIGGKAEGEAKKKRSSAQNILRQWGILDDICDRLEDVMRSRLLT
ncbi:hypothetical protein GGI35DRAFT_446484 [Trichoderma velutinum]